MQRKSARRGLGTWASAIAGLVILVTGGFWIGRNRTGHSGTAPADPVQLERQAGENPENFRAQLRWGVALTQAKRLEAAVPVLTHAEHLSPTDARPYAWLGVAAISEHRFEEARELLGKAMQRDPANITAIRALANLDAQSRRLRPAIQGFERLVKLRPTDADAWQRMGLLLFGAGERYRSLDALTRAASLDPTDLFTQGSLGNIALNAGRLEQANHAFRAILAREPNDPAALIGLTRVMIRLDPSPASLKAAEQQADAVVRNAPSAEAYRARGQVRMAQRRFGEAIKDLNASRALDPKVLDTYVFLSECYATDGKPDLARKASAEYDRLTAEAQLQARAVDQGTSGIK